MIVTAAARRYANPFRVMASLVFRMLLVVTRINVTYKIIENSKWTKSTIIAGSWAGNIGFRMGDKTATAASPIMKIVSFTPPDARPDMKISPMKNAIKMFPTADTPNASPYPILSIRKTGWNNTWSRSWRILAKPRNNVVSMRYRNATFGCNLYRPYRFQVRISSKIKQKICVHAVISAPSLSNIPMAAHIKSIHPVGFLSIEEEASHSI